MVGPLLALSLVISVAKAELVAEPIRCLPYLATSENSFSAKGLINSSSREAYLDISLNGGEATRREFEVVAIQNRLMYKTYFLENPNSDLPSAIIRTSTAGLSVMSEVFSVGMDRFTADCNFADLP